jgi:hypothetical protein
MILWHFLDECASAIRVRSASVRIVPGTVRTVGELGLISIPSAEFDQRIHPLVQVPASDVRPDVANLLLASTPDFLHVVEVFFNRPAPSDCFQDLLGFDLWVGAEVGCPTPVLELDDDNWMTPEVSFVVARKVLYRCVTSCPRQM